MSLFAFSVLGEAQIEAPAATILVFNYSEASPNTIRIAEAVASRILAKAGLSANWINCFRTASSLSQPACQKEQASSEIRVRILSDHVKGKSQGSAFGFATAPIFASVYYEPVLRLATVDNVESETPVVLGCVISHEIGHLLLGSNSHASVGLMQRHWGRVHVRQMMKGQLLFTREQAMLIQAEVWRRMKQALTGRPTPAFFSGLDARQEEIALSRQGQTPLELFRVTDEEQENHSICTWEEKSGYSTEVYFAPTEPRTICGPYTHPVPISR